MRYRWGLRHGRLPAGRRLTCRGLLVAGLCFWPAVPGGFGCRERPASTPVPDRNVVLLVNDKSGSYESALIQGAQAAVDEELDTVLTVLEARPNQATADPPRIEVSFSLIGILVACEPTEALDREIEKAAERGVSVYVIGNLFPPGETGAKWIPDLTVACEEELAGAEGVGVLLDNLTGRGVLQRKSEIAILQRPGGQQATKMRMHGFKSGLLLSPVLCTTLPPIEINGPTSEATARIVTLLREHPAIRMLLSTHGDLLLPAAQAVEKVRPAVRPVIGGFEATPENRKALEDDGIQMLVDLQPAKLARRAAVFLLHRGHSQAPLRAIAYVPAEILTKQSISAAPSTAPASAPTKPSPASRPRQPELDPPTPHDS